MEPTTAELIFWIAIGVIVLILAVPAMFGYTGDIEMNEYKKRDICRRQSEWERMLK